MDFKKRLPMWLSSIPAPIVIFHWMNFHNCTPNGCILRILWIHWYEKVPITMAVKAIQDMQENNHSGFLLPCTIMSNCRTILCRVYKASIHDRWICWFDHLQCWQLLSVWLLHYLTGLRKYFVKVAIIKGDHPNAAFKINIEWVDEMFCDAGLGVKNVFFQHLNPFLMQFF